MVVTANAGHVTKRIRAVIKTSLFPVGKPVSASEKYIYQQGKFTLNGIKSPDDHTPTKAGLHTNQKGDSSATAVQQVAGSTITVEPTSFLSAVKGTGGNYEFADTVKSQVASDNLKPGVSRVQLARSEVKEALTTAQGASTTATVSSAGLPANLTIRQDTYIASKTPLQFDNVEIFNGATLYVEGDIVMQLVRGKGAVIAQGDIGVVSGTRLLLPQAAIALVAGKDLRLGSDVPDSGKLLPSGTESLVQNLAEAASRGLANVTQAEAAAEALTANMETHAGFTTTVRSLQTLREVLQVYSLVSAGGSSANVSAPAVLTDAQEALYSVLTDGSMTLEESYSQFVELNGLDTPSEVRQTRGRFQGLAFANGQLRVNGYFHVYGGLQSRQEMYLGTHNADVMLTYCESYRNLCPSSVGSPYLVSYQEE